MSFVSQKLQFFGIFEKFLVKPLLQNCGPKMSKVDNFCVTKAMAFHKSGQIFTIFLLFWAFLSNFWPNQIWKLTKLWHFTVKVLSDDSSVFFSDQTIFLHQKMRLVKWNRVCLFIVYSEKLRNELVLYILEVPFLG